MLLHVHNHTLFVSLKETNTLKETNRTTSDGGGREEKREEKEAEKREKRRE